MKDITNLAFKDSGILEPHKSSNYKPYYREYNLNNYISVISSISAKMDKSSENGSRDFCRESFNEGVTIAKEGHTANISKVGESLKLLNAEVNKSKFKNAICGGVLNVGRYLSGEPECFRKTVKTPIQRDDYNIYIPLGYSANVDQKTVIKFMTVLTKISRDISKDNNLVLWGYLSTVFRTPKRTSLLSVFKLKERTKRLYPHKLSAVLHPTFLRRISMRYIENIGYGTKGYGSPLKPHIPFNLPLNTIVLDSITEHDNKLSLMQVYKQVINQINQQIKTNNHARI